MKNRCSSSMDDKTIVHYQVDKWILTGMIIAIVYSLCRLLYLPIISAAMIGLLVMILTGIFALVVTVIFGRPCETAIVQSKTISFFPFKVNKVKCREKSNRDFRMSYIFLLAMLMVGDFHLVVDHLLYQRSLNDYKVGYIFVAFSMPLLFAWGAVRQVKLNDEWLWVRGAAVFVFPCLFPLDCYGYLSYWQVNPIVFGDIFVLLSHCTAVVIILFYNFKNTIRKETKI